MKDKTKNFSKSSSKEFFIPLNEIKVNVYKVIAKNEEDAIQKVNNPEGYLNKTIDHFEVSIKETKSTSMRLVKKWVTRV